MAQFTYSVVEPLDYDFTGIPSNSGKGRCKGKGTIPEPTQDRIQVYSQAVQDLYSIKSSEDLKTELETAAGEAGAAGGDRQTKLLELTADLCQQSPSSEELTELPPRYRNAFMSWVYQEISDPEVSSADTRR